jgi:hypothetical protein
MAEVWRELPWQELIEGRWYEKWLSQDRVFTYAKYVTLSEPIVWHQEREENPTDALIDLLIWLEKRKEKV